MKLIKKILLPLVTIGTIATPIVASSCSCSMTRDADGYNPFPAEWLVIEDGVLKGFNEDHLRQDQVAGYDKLSIPANVTKIDNTAFAVGDSEHDAGLAIKKIDYKPGCLCTDLGSSTFTGCKNLEMVVLPPKYNTTQEGQFLECSKFKTLDITNVEQDIEINVNNFFLYAYDCVQIGEIWLKNNPLQIAIGKKFKETKPIVYEEPQDSDLKDWNLIFK